MERCSVPRLMLAAAQSGQGKTALTCALLRCVQRAGRNPCAFKCGPDYIDPMFHRAVLGVPSRNLDLYFSTEGEVQEMLASHSAGTSLAVLEGVMGFYDGISATDTASSWHLAQATQTPVVLTVVPKGSALTLAATLKGLKAFRTPSQIAGVILNQCSEKLYRLLSPAIRQETGVEVYGYIPSMPDCAIPSRHLGLVPADELPKLRDIIERVSKQMEQTVDIPALLALADSAPALEIPAQPMPDRAVAVRIGVARDKAFCFYYEENLDQLRQAGAQLIPFSPLEDRTLPEGICGMYFGGGYPELWAKSLCENESMRTCVRTAIHAGMPTLGECGGFLYLQQSLEDERGQDWPMVGVFSGIGIRSGTHGRFGYAELTAKEQTSYLYPGETIRGHEFHKWDCTENGSVCQAEKPASGAGWDCMSVYKNCLAGFPHLYFRSNSAFARRFVERCRQFEREAL